jgi:DNA-binding HxlR family transcriptional regulator
MESIEAGEIGAAIDGATAAIDGATAADVSAVVASPATYRLQTRLYYCPVNLAIEALTGKWKTLLVWQLTLNGSVRYGALKRAVPGITHKMLAQSLRQLEADGLVERHVFDVVPPHVEYRLSPAGRRLEPVMRALEQFGEVYATAQR